MEKNNYITLISLFLLCTVLACAPKAKIKVIDKSKTLVQLNDKLIVKDTVWQGVIKVNGVIEVAKDTTLTIQPGTRINFEWMDKDNDGIGDSGLLIKGSLIAIAKVNRPIVFTSAGKSKPKAWNEIKFDSAQPSHFKYCYFKYAHWGAHVHFTPVIFEYCRFEKSSGGIRFRSGPIKIRHCLIQNNDIGIRYLYSDPTIEHSTIRHNNTGIFIREGAKHPVITKNNIYDNKGYNLKLGEAQTTDITCPENFWGSTNQKFIKEKIFDYNNSDYLGKVNYQPVASTPWGTDWER